jgi:hypothetical protein
MSRAFFSTPMSHNVYCVKKETQHYICGGAPQEETLLDKVCAGAAFLLCIAAVILLGGVL